MPQSKGPNLPSESKKPVATAALAPHLKLPGSTPEVPPVQLAATAKGYLGNGRADENPCTIHKDAIVLGNSWLSPALMSAVG